MDQSRVLRASLRPSLGTAGCTARRGPQDCQAALGSKALSARLPQDLFFLVASGSYLAVTRASGACSWPANS